MLRMLLPRDKQEAGLHCACLARGLEGRDGVPGPRRLNYSAPKNADCWVVLHKWRIKTS